MNNDIGIKITTMHYFSDIEAIQMMESSFEGCINQVLINGENTLEDVALIEEITYVGVDQHYCLP